MSLRFANVFADSWQDKVKYMAIVDASIRYAKEMTDALSGLNEITPTVGKFMFDKYKKEIDAYQNVIRRAYQLVGEVEPVLNVVGKCIRESIHLRSYELKLGDRLAIFIDNIEKQKLNQAQFGNNKLTNSQDDQQEQNLTHNIQQINSNNKLQPNEQESLQNAKPQQQTIRTQNIMQLDKIVNGDK